MAIAAALEDESYPVEELVYDIADLDGGFRFCGEDINRWGGRLALVCHKAYGLQSVPGYLENGVPPKYGAMASASAEIRSLKTALNDSAVDLYRLDGADAADTLLVAVADGTVAYYDPGYASYPGRVVILSHPLSDGRVIYSMYAHLGSVLVTQGQIVARGQPIGTVLYQAGDSHLHFEMRWFLDGSQIYPSGTSCNGIVYGRGYTYLTHPDDFPALDQGYVDPDAFIQARGGPSLTPIGLPDPRTPALNATIHGAVTRANRVHGVFEEAESGATWACARVPLP